VQPTHPDSTAWSLQLCTSAPSFKLLPLPYSSNSYAISTGRRNTHSYWLKVAHFCKL
jgi:hypothetical protein